MMRLRISIRGGMALVVFIAVATAALRSASELWSSTVFTLTLVILATAVLGAFFSRPRRPFWAGFAFFGCGYMLLAFGPWFSDHVAHRLSTNRLVDELFRRANPGVTAAIDIRGASSGISLPPYFSPNVAGRGRMVRVSSEHFESIAHCLFALLAALLGGVIATSFAKADRPNGPTPSRIR